MSKIERCLYPACKAEITDVVQDLSRSAWPYSHTLVSSIEMYFAYLQSCIKKLNLFFFQLPYDVVLGVIVFIYNEN